MKKTTHLEKLLALSPKSNLTIGTKTTGIVPQPEKKEAVLLVSDFDYGIWNYGTVRENYSESLLVERLQSVTEQAKTLLMRDGCDHLSVVNIGGHLYSRCHSTKRDKLTYINQYQQNIMRISNVIQKQILSPLLPSSSGSRLLNTDCSFFQHDNFSLFGKCEAESNSLINQSFDIWKSTRHTTQFVNIDGLLDPFEIFDSKVGIYHGKGILPQTIRKRKFPYTLNYLLTGWNPLADHYYFNNIEVIANGRVHQSAAWDKMGGNVREEPHQKLLVFGERSGLLDIHYLKVA